ncbi:hypothetical protein SIAG_02127 [Staphylococcus aureus subsp. aureus EMRSA16]|nr:hypothetical protein SIAG_02127 [Staphylococcus aureus subsp. aureus EMRSA16]
MTERKCACNKLFSTLVRGPNKENFEKKFYRQCELGCGSQQREIGFPISTDNASWRGPNKEKLDSQFLQTMQVGGAPTKRNWIPNFYRQCKLGWDNEINFVKISFLSHSRVLC